MSSEPTPPRLPPSPHDLQERPQGASGPEHRAGALPPGAGGGDPQGTGAAETFHEGEEEAPPGHRLMAVVRWVLVLAAAAAAGWSVLYYMGRLPQGAATQSSSAKRYYCPMHPGVVQDLPGDCPICGMSLVLAQQGGGKAAPAEEKASGAYACPMHPDHRSDVPGAECPVCGMEMEAAPAPQATGGKPDAGAGAGAEKAGAYACPMHLDQRSDDPKARCPICRMFLTLGGKSGEAEAAGQGSGVQGLVTLELSDERIQLMGMRTARAARAPLARELRTVGYVAADERGQATISARFSGWVERLFVTETGQRVSRGQVLAAIYSPQVLSAQQELLDTRRWSAGAGGAGQETRQLAGALDSDARQRLSLLGISSEEIEEVLRTGAPLRAIKIRSSVSGHVLQRSVLQGAYVQAGAPLFQVADLSTVWVLADIYEHDVGRVNKGQPARVELPAYPGETFDGKVRFIYPTLDRGARTLRVRVELKNPGLRLKPGMYGHVVLEVAPQQALVVPSEAVVDTGLTQYVFVVKPGGKFEPRRITPGLRSGERVQVLEGLTEGETVVTTGNFLVDSESRLQAALAGFGKAEPSTEEPAAGAGQPTSGGEQGGHAH